MSDTVTSAVLSDLPCQSCRALVAVIRFALPIGGKKSWLTVCAMCLVGIIDQALDTRYSASLQVGLVNRALGNKASALKRSQGKRVTLASRRKIR